MRAGRLKFHLLFVCLLIATIFFQMPAWGLSGDLNGDGCVDIGDLTIINAARNTPASGPDDPRDLDGDGMITGLDARKLVLLCSRPRCAACPVTPAPGVTLTALPSGIEPGEACTLSWSSTNGTSASIEPGIGEVAASGSIAIFPEETTTYTITVTGPAGSAAASVEVHVLDPPGDVDLGVDEDEQQGGGGLLGGTVRILNGNGVEARTDLDFPSPHSLGLKFEAFYNSRSDRAGILGYGWSHTYGAILDPGYTLGNRVFIRIMDGTGRFHYFKEEAPGQWKGAFRERTCVRQEAEGYVWYMLDGTRQCFSGAGKLLWMEDEKGNRLILAYDGSRVSSVTDGVSGRTLGFHYNPEGRLASISGPVTTAVTTGYWVTYYGYDPAGNLTGITYADGSGFNYTYNDSNDIHNLTEKKDKAGHLLSSFGYDAGDRVTNHFQVDGRGMNIQYEGETLVSVTDAYGVQRSYTLGKAGNRKRVTSVSGLANAPYAEGNIVRWAYDESMRLIEVESANGRIDRYLDHDGRGNPGRVILGSGTTKERVIAYTWHPAMDAPLSRTESSVLNGGNKVTILDYDSDGNAVPNENPSKLPHRIIERGFTRGQGGDIVPYEYITRFTYNASGQALTMDGPLSGDDDTASFNYHPSTGDLLSITRPLIGSTILTEYDAAGRPGKVRDVNGQTQSFQYDGRGRVTAVSHDSDGGAATMSYNQAGQPRSMTDPDGIARTFEYDAAYGRLIKIIDPEGNYIRYQYNNQGNRIEMSKHDASGSRSSRKRWDYRHPDMPGRLWKEIHADDSFIKYDYDEEGNIAAMTDAEDHLTAYDYDLFSRIKNVTQPGDAITQYGYDAHGNLVSVTDAEGHETTYAYDDMGRLLRTISPDTGTVNYLYDEAGNLIRKTDARGIAVNYDYDDLNRLTAVRFPDPAQNISYAYDSGINAMGKLSGIVDPSGTLGFGYDARGRLTTRVSAIEGHNYTFSQIFTPGGRVNTVSYPSGRTLNYARDAMGRMRDLGATYNSNTVMIAQNMNYNPFGGPKGMNTGSGGEVENQSGECDCIEAVNPGSMMEQRYTYDKNRNLLTITAPNTPWYNQTFRYDALNRLTGAEGRYGSVSYTYDKVGNRLSRNLNGDIENYTYQAGTNTLTGITGANPLNYTHDANGNITGMGTRTLIYNQNNRLIRVEENGAPIGEYAYNALGQRVKKNVNGSVTIFHYDANGNLIAEGASNGAITKEYLYMGQIRMAMVDAATQSFYYFLNDRLGTPQLMTDNTGTVVWEASYKPFGEATIHPNASVVNNFRFPGQYFDQETGLYYNYYRFYDPKKGRYLTPDLLNLGNIQIAKQNNYYTAWAGDILIQYGLRNPQLLNFYPYALNNSINWNDPWGLIVMYGGFSFGVGAGIDTKPIQNDNFNFFGGSTGRYVGTTRDKGAQEGIFTSGGAGRIMGLAAGGGVLLGMNLGDVEDFEESEGSVGILLGPISFEVIFSKDGGISGFGFSFLGRGLGLGFFGLGTGTWLGPINTLPPLEKNSCE